MTYTGKGHCKPIIRFPTRAVIQSTDAPSVAKKYGYPVLNASTQFVALIELGGGYLDSDNAAYCSKFRLPIPSVQVVGIDGATNDPSDTSGANEEVALDVQCAIGAGGGRVGIILYFAPNTSQGFVDAIARVAQDNIACAVSISWGSSEPNWTAADRAAMDAAMQACVAKGIAVFAASGDDGSSDGSPGDNVDYPSSSPYCIGCGGTSLTQTGESAWDSGGGGFSAIYPQPIWQTPVITTTKRSVPDMAAVADPNTGYATVSAGKWGVVGGTSAAAPMLATWYALMVSVRGKRFTGFINSCYQNINLFTDILTGNNGDFTAHPGFDNCTGAGTPTLALTTALIGVVVPPTPLPPSPPIPVPPPAGNAYPTRQQLDLLMAYAEKGYVNNRYDVLILSYAQKLLDHMPWPNG